jgi:hypothetical protein
MADNFVIKYYREVSPTYSPRPVPSGYHVSISEVAADLKMIMKWECFVMRSLISKKGLGFLSTGDSKAVPGEPSRGAYLPGTLKKR